MPGHRDEPPRRQARTRVKAARTPLARRRCPTVTASCSAIKQVASGRFGVTSRYLSSAIEESRSRWRRAQSQARAGICPGKKVYPWIAEVRRSTPGVGLDFPAAAP